MGNYIVVKNGRVVEGIHSDQGANGAYLAQTEEGDLYVKCGPPSIEIPDRLNDLPNKEGMTNGN